MQGLHSDATREAVLGAIDAQHHDIRAILARLETTEDLREAATLLDELDRLLRPHFEEEERPGGILETLEESAYSQQRALTRIRAEHRALRAAAADTVRAAHACIDGPVAGVLQAARNLCEQILKHERRENEVFLDAAYAEAGGSE